MDVTRQHLQHAPRYQIQPQLTNIVLGGRLWLLYWSELGPDACKQRSLLQ
jgi:hypothetical protein